MDPVLICAIRFTSRTSSCTAAHLHIKGLTFIAVATAVLRLIANWLGAPWLDAATAIWYTLQVNHVNCRRRFISLQYIINMADRRSKLRNAHAWLL